jgi:hypothetical protein
MESDRTATRAKAAAVCIWTAVFSLIHWYWSLGGRAGLGAEAAEADAAFATSWFAVYNAGVAALSLAVCALVGFAIWRPTGKRTRGRVARLMLLVAILLLIRGLLGVTLLVPEIVKGTVGERPWMLLLIEPYFLLGGALFAVLWLSLRPSVAPRPIEL